MIFSWPSCIRAPRVLSERVHLRGRHISFRAKWNQHKHFLCQCQPLHIVRRDFFSLQLDGCWANVLIMFLGCSLHKLGVWLAQVLLIHCGSGIWMSPSTSLSQSQHLYVQQCHSGPVEPSAFLCYTCSGMCLHDQDRLEHWDYSQNLCFSLPFLILLQSRCLYCQAVSLKLQKNACNSSWACCPLCPPVPSLAWAQPGTWRKSRGRSCLWPVPHGHISCWCSVQRQEHSKAPGSKAWSPHHTERRGRWLWRGFFTSLLHLLRSFPLYRTF